MAAMIPEKAFERLLGLDECWAVVAAEYETEPIERFFLVMRETACKRRLKSAAGGARKVRHLPGRRERFLAFEVKSGKFAAR